jgi:hypothetical protein
MRNQILKRLATFGLFLTLVAASVQAQTENSIKVNVPFDFTAGQTSLSAGIYSVKLISTNVLLVCGDTTKCLFVNAPRAIESRITEKPERIILNRYGDRYFLSQVWLRADAGRQINPSRAERALAKEPRFAMGDAKSQKVLVALR